MIDGHHVRMVNASQVDHLLCEFDCGGSFVGTFKVFPKNEKVNVSLNTSIFGMTQTLHFSVHMSQFHVLVNNATTGHKLQGRMLDHIFVNDWTCSDNWPHVVLSRVRTLQGLFLRKPLN